MYQSNLPVEVMDFRFPEEELQCLSNELNIMILSVKVTILPTPTPRSGISTNPSNLNNFEFVCVTGVNH